MRCRLCRWYQHVNLGGECHLSPPVRFPRKFDSSASAGNRVRSEERLWDWPEVRPEDWCGEFLARLS